MEESRATQGERETFLMALGFLSSHSPAFDTRRSPRRSRFPLPFFVFSFCIVEMNERMNESNEGGKRANTHIDMRNERVCVCVCLFAFLSCFTFVRLFSIEEILLK